jgi:putative Mn2+ efflux pump MntP
MIRESRATEEESCDDDFSMKAMVPLAIATSIDALATGIVFVPFPNWLNVAVICIGVVSFLFSLIGTQIGYYVGKRFSFKWGVLGGLILIGIGTKILIEHTCFS